MRIIFRLAKNPLDHIPTTQLIHVKDSLELLDLTNTNLAVIRNHEFHKMDLIQSLFLNDLKFLEYVEPLAFHGLHHLDILEMKNNPNLKHIDPFAFYDTLQDNAPNVIKRLDLSKNALTTISEGLLYWTKTNVVLLDGNPWHCDCLLSWLANNASSSGINFNPFMTCSSPPDLKDTPIMLLKTKQFHCVGMFLL
jgi:hypothetical protein